MLFINAGIMPSGALGPFQNTVDLQVESVVKVNALQPIYLAKVLIPQLLARNKLSAIVITSSQLGKIPVPLCVPYSCTKTFASFLARGLSYEYDGKIDCLDWALGQVKTNLNKDPKGPMVATQPEVVSGILKNLGKERSSHGCITHDKISFLYSMKSED